MAPKKDQSLPTRKEAIAKTPWPNLPQHLLNLIARQPNLLHHITFPGPTKSLTTATRQCTTTTHPQLHDLGLSTLSKTLPHFINIYFRTHAYPCWYYSNRDSPPQFWFTPPFVGYSRGLLVTREPNSSVFCMYKVDNRVCWFLPPWDVNIPFKFVTQTLSKMGSHSLVVVTGLSSPALMVYRGGEDGYVWIKQVCSTIDPFDAKKQSMQFTNIIGYEDKLYALSLQGTLVVMEDINLNIVITKIGRNRVIPSVSAHYFKEHLLESRGEILLVFFVYRKTLGVVDQVEVFRLHFPKLVWIKLESLEERALFMEDECCVWVDSRQMGCKGNCVYFKQSSDTEWYTYDMETDSISAGMSIADA